MELDDVSNILRKIEVKIKDVIKISELLSFLDLSEHSRQHIEAQIREHGSPHASSLFFENIRGRCSSFYTLIAALLLQKINQPDVYDIILKQIRKYYEKKPAKLKEVLKKIRDAKRELGVPVSDDEDTSGSNDDASMDVRTRRPPQQLSSRPLARARSPHTSPDSNTDPSVLYSRTGAPGPRPPALYERRQEPAPAPNTSSGFLRNRGGGKPLKDLRPSVHKQLEGEVTKTTETREPYWMVISESPHIGLDISMDDQDRIEDSPRPGREFLRVLHTKGYCQEDLEHMFELVNMRDAQHILRQQRNEGLPPNQAPRPTNPFNMAGPGAHVEPSNILIPTNPFNMAGQGANVAPNNISRPATSFNMAGPGANVAPNNISRPTSNYDMAGPGANVAPYNISRPTTNYNMSGLGANGEPSNISKPTRYYNTHLNMAMPEQDLEPNNISRPTHSMAGPGSANLEPSRVSRSTNDLNLAGSGANLDDEVKALNITEQEQQTRSLPFDFGNRPELQPIQVSGSLHNEPSFGSSVSSSSSSGGDSYPSNASPKPTRAVQPVQPQSDRDNLAADPNADMDAQKLRRDWDSAALNSASCGRVQENRADDAGGTLPDQPPTTISPTAAVGGGTVPVAMATQHLMPATTTIATKHNTRPPTAVVSPISAADPDSMSSYGEDSSDFSVLENITRDAGATSVSMSTIADESINEETELKGTVAVQPTTDRTVFQPDAQREAEKLRDDRIHQLDHDPAAMDNSFRDIQQCLKQQNNTNQDLVGENEVVGQSHVFRSTLTEPDLVGDRSPAALERPGIEEGQGQVEVMERPEVARSDVERSEVERSELDRSEVASQDRTSSENDECDASGCSVRADYNATVGGTEPTSDLSVTVGEAESGANLSATADGAGFNSNLAGDSDTAGNRPNLSILSSQ